MVGFPENSLDMLVFAIVQRPTNKQTVQQVSKARSQQTGPEKASVRNMTLAAIGKHFQKFGTTTNRLLYPNLWVSE